MPALPKSAPPPAAQSKSAKVVLERILNHVTGSTALSITPLGRIYNRHLYLDEMRAALTRWEAEVLRLLGN